MAFEIVLVTHSAGELSAWAQPLVVALGRWWPRARITLVLTPSQYLTGKEEAFARALPGVERVVGRRQFGAWALWGRAPYQLGDNGLVLSAGGDLFYPRILGRRLGFPRFAYVEGNARAYAGYQKVFFRETVGDLMVDSLAPDEKLPLIRPADSPGFTIALLPGSRPAHVAYLQPFLRQVSAILAQRLPQARLVWKTSPFSDDLVRDQDYPAQKNYRGVDFAIAIPGTNTAHLAICGIPFICVMPFERPEDVPLPGLMEYLGKLPLIGRRLRLKAFDYILKTQKYLALPNRLAKAEIAPELCGCFTPAEVANCAWQIITDYQKRQRMSKQLKIAMGPPGAADKIVKELRARGSRINEKIAQEE